MSAAGEVENGKKPVGLMTMRSLMAMGEQFQHIRWEYTLDYGKWKGKYRNLVAYFIFGKFGRKRKEVDKIAFEEKGKEGTERLLKKKACAGIYKH